MRRAIAGGRNDFGRDESRPYIEKGKVMEFFAWSFFPLKPQSQNYKLQI